MRNDCIIIRIDPDRRTIAQMKPTFGKNATPTLTRLVRAKRLGSRAVHRIDNRDVVVVAAIDVDEANKKWRLRGGEETAGIGVIFGRIVGDNPGMIDSPVDAAWVRERIEWLDGEDVEAREARAQEVLTIIDDDLRLALSRAFVMPDGGMWLSAEDKAQVGAAAITMSLGTERSGGQNLTALGEAVHDLLIADVADLG